MLLQQIGGLGMHDCCEQSRSTNLDLAVLGLFLGVYEGQLRYFSAEGELIPTPEEAAAQAEARATRLVEQLKALRVEPEA
ncbi:MAG: hypothetical protein AAFY26_00790 [Cyanobacteria bacterium J06638_22]